jgi:hypothetical protein
MLGAAIEVAIQQKYGLDSGKIKMAVRSANTEAVQSADD